LRSFEDDSSGLLSFSEAMTGDFRFSYSRISLSTTSMMPPAEPRSQLPRTPFQKLSDKSKWASR
jgi:hypothetical protein